MFELEPAVGQRQPQLLPQLHLTLGAALVDLVGEEPGKSKLTKAEKTGVPQLSEQDLLGLLGRG